MNRNQAKEFYPFLQAYAEGKVIECRTKPSAMKGTDVPNEWTEMKEIEFWNNTEYRIKPEHTYRPFKDVEECWNEMQKHQPFGWVKHKKDGDRSLITSISGCERKIYFDESDGWCFDRIMKSYTFADGTPFGIKVKE